jgi:hypothetical protein
MFFATPGILFVRALLPDPGGKAREFVADEAPPTDEGAGSGFPLGANMTTLRALMTNFDIGLPLLLAASIVDVLHPAAFDLPLAGEMSARGVWLTYYAVVLPIDFLDYLRTYLVRDHFRREATRLTGLARQFRAGDEAK